jgi:hypothetical protein
MSEAAFFVPWAEKGGSAVNTSFEETKLSVKPTIQTSPDQSELLNTEQAAERLRVSPRTLEKWRVEGAGPCFLKIGRLCYYTEDHLDAWKLTRLRRSTSDQGAK